MQAMLLTEIGKPLQEQEIGLPNLKANEILVKVAVCGVCRTDLHVVDGELPNPKLPLVLGHEIVGHVTQLGSGASQFKIGDLVGIPWLGHTCGKCFYCLNKQENLCDKAEFTGYTRNGGYAEYIAADENYCFSLPNRYDLVSMAPLLCAGLIGWRSYKLSRGF